jgi:hypothetical protein
MTHPEVYIDTGGLEIPPELSSTAAMNQDTVRIGCGCGFWGDSAAGPAQLVHSGSIDFLVLDYLSEITMSLLARARQKRPELGYATDFVTAVMAPLARQIVTGRIKVVANAGGVNPRGCRDALRAVLDRLGVKLSVAVVSGDDVMGALPALRDRGALDLETGRFLPANTISANAYLGAFPIAEALRAGADVVITGRCVDSALALGPLLARFGWGPGDLDPLAMGSLAGHIIECGTQATGGIFTDWRSVQSGWDDMGYPIVECEPDGTFVVTKPANTGGRVTPATVAEQITYEVHDPAAYVLPDVICDWRAVGLEDLGQDRVRVTGARGMPPTADYKASLTWHDGFRCLATLMIVGNEAGARAQRVGAAILERTRRLFATNGYADYRATSIEVLGVESMYGIHARATGSREVVLKIAVAHAHQEPLELFAREIFPAATSMAQSITGFAAGRPSVQPVVRLASCLVPKSDVRIEVEVDGCSVALCPAPPDSASSPMRSSTPTSQDRTSDAANLAAGRAVASPDRAGAAATPAGAGAAASPDQPTPAAAPVRSRFTPSLGPSSGAPSSAPLLSPTTAPSVEVPLVLLAWARSGDKGDTANIGVIARRPEFMPAIAEALTPEAVRSWLAHLVEGEVRRFDWPGLNGWNFVLRQALGGGGVASLRYDPQGKSYAQILMDFPVRVPASWNAPGGLIGC